MHSFQSAFTSMHKHVGASNDQSACSQSQHIRLTCVNLKKKVNVCLSPHIWSVGVRYIFLVPDTRYLAAVAVLGSTRCWRNAHWYQHVSAGQNGAGTNVHEPYKAGTLVPARNSSRH